MKRLFAVLLPLSLLSCDPYFLYSDTIPDLKASASNKSIVVYLRSLNLPELKPVTVSTPAGTVNSISVDEEGPECFIYLDGKYIGGTTNLSLTTFEVDSGIHIIISEADFQGKMKLHVKPGRVYYVEEMPYQMGPLGTNVNIQTISKNEALEKMNSINYRYVRANPENMKDDMEADDLQDELEEWDEWARENPEQAEKEIGYEGYPMQ